MVRQPEIQKDDVRTGFPRLLQGFVDIRGRRQNLETRLAMNQRGEALTQKPVVVDQYQGNGRRDRNAADDSGLDRRLLHRFLLHGVAVRRIRGRLWHVRAYSRRVGLRRALLYL